MDILPSKKLGNGSRHIIFLHDWFGSSDNYKSTSPLWDLDGKTLHFVNLRGHGEAKNMLGQYSLSEAVEDLKAYAKSHKIEAFDLVCHSMTALVGYQLAHDKFVKKLFLTTPVPPEGSPGDPEIQAMIKSAIPSKEGRKQMLEYLYGGRLSKGWINFKLERFFEDVATDAVMGYFEMYSQKIDADHLKISCPMHVFVGDKDHPPFTEEILKACFERFKNVSWSIHPEVGHAPMEEAPPYFVNAVENFLN